MFEQHRHETLQYMIYFLEKQLDDFNAIAPNIDNATLSQTLQRQEFCRANLIAIGLVKVLKNCAIAHEIDKIFSVDAASLPPLVRDSLNVKKTAVNEMLYALDVVKQYSLSTPTVLKKWELKYWEVDKKDAEAFEKAYRDLQQKFFLESLEEIRSEIQAFGQRHQPMPAPPNRALK